MGLAASQCRFLMLTSRESDVESKLMTLSNQQMALSQKATRLSSDFAKALINSKDLNSFYTYTDNNTYLQLKNGFYSIGLKGSSFYFGIDDKGKIMTGFVYTNEGTPIYQINKETSKLVKVVFFVVKNQKINTI